MLVTPAALLAQNPQTPPQSPPQTPEDELTAARNQLHSAADQLAKTTLPMDTEPAVHFKA